MKGVILLAPVLCASLVVAGLTRAEDATVKPAENAHDNIVIDVSAGNGTFSVHAENAPFADVLDRLAAAGGFSVKTQLDFSGHLVTIELDDVPWLQGLPQLLQGWSYSLAMNQSMNRPEMLHILAVSEVMPMGKEEGGGFVPEIERDEAAERERSPAERLAEAIKIANELVERDEDPVGIAVKDVEAAAAAAREAASDDPASANAYAEALHALAGLRDPRVMDVLVPALDSEMTGARSAALQVLRDAPAPIDEPTIDRIYNIAASDSDPQVRRDALEVYVRYGDRDDVLWVVQSLARKEGPTRDIAVREWIRIEQEMMEADLSDQQVEEAMQQ